MTDFALRPYQQEAVDGLRRSIAQGSRHPILVAPTGCHEKGTLILMADGTRRRVETLGEGDKVMGPDSRPRAVTAFHHGVDEMFRIRPKKGDPFVVNGDHVLAVKVVNDGSKQAGSVETVTVREWLQANQTYRHTRKLYRVSVDFPELDAPLPVDPYLLGVLIGDGCLTNGVTICNPDGEVLEAVSTMAQAAGVEVSHLAAVGRCQTYSLVTPRGQKNPMRDALRAFGLLGCDAYGKRIPDPYMVASAQERAELLAGLIDTDGHLGNGCYDFVTASEALSDGVCFVARSLGLGAYRKKCRKRWQAGEGDYWRVSISGELAVIPCRIGRKAALPRKQKKRVSVSGFDVEPVGVGAYYGFECDGDHLYVMGDFTVTHNSGKTRMAGAVIEGAMHKGRTVLFLAPRRELIYQAERAFGRLGLDCGLLMAGEEADWTARVQIASWDSLRSWIRRGKMRPPDPDVVIVDEAHLSLANTYLDMLNAFWADKVVIGLTATPARTDGMPLGVFYSDLVSAATVRELTDAGYLVPVRYFAPTTADLSGLRVVRGDYETGEMAKRVDQPRVIGDVVSNWCRIASDRQTVVFAATVAHAAHLAERFREVGVSSDLMHCQMPLDERKAVLARVESGETQVVCNVDILTMGYDRPELSCAILARPTKSIVRYMQTVGRVLRPAAGKTDAIVIDHGGVVDELGMVDEPVPWTLGGTERVQDRKAKLRQKAEAKPITCGECGAVYEGQRICPECGANPPVRGKAPETVDADLVEIDRERRRRNREFSWEEKQQWMGALRWVANERGRKPGWAAHKYRAKFGVWPNDPRVNHAPPVAPTPEIRGWIKSQDIAFAKRRRA